MIRKSQTVSIITFLSLLIAGPVFAHSIVTPNQVGIAATQTFTLTIPTEKESGTTTSVRLILPPGLDFVTPVVQAGWTATVKTAPIPSGTKASVADDGDIATFISTEIDWTGGSIPSGQKELFMFSAQVPSSPTELDWKIYQGYLDGSIVSWDLGPNDSQPKDAQGNSDFSSKGPYSKTTVVNDLNHSYSGEGITGQSVSSAKDKISAQGFSQSSESVALSMLAVVLSIVSLAIIWKKK